METLFKPKKKKHRNKHTHRSNPRIKEWTPCYVCQWLNGTGNAKGAYAHHEVFHKGASWIRNMSMDIDASIPICMEHDEEIHRSGNGLDMKLKQHYQQKLMDDNEWTILDFFNKIGENYLDEDWNWE